MYCLRLSGGQMFRPTNRSSQQQPLPGDRGHLHQIRRQHILPCRPQGKFSERTPQRVVREMQPHLAFNSDPCGFPVWASFNPVISE